MKLKESDFSVKGNKNYTATIIKIQTIRNLENSDNLGAVDMFGYTAIVNKHTTKEGDIAIFFVAESTITPEFLSKNNLYRHGNLNEDTSKKGFMEDSGRVKAIKLRQNISNALLCSTEFIENVTGSKYSNWEELVGVQFDTFGNKTVCFKYEIEIKQKVGQSPKAQLIDSVYMPEHYQTLQLFKIDKNINPKTNLIVTQKLHGTSIRVANTFCNRKLSLFEKMLVKFGVKVKEKEYAHVYGSRKVIKTVENDDYENKKDSAHYYGQDIWSQYGAEIVGQLPKGYILYGELIGKMVNENGEPTKDIQKDYTYGLLYPELYVYRIATVNEDGFITDLSWNQVKQFCSTRQLKTVPEFEVCTIGNFKWEKYKDKNYGNDKLRFTSNIFNEPPVELYNDSLVDEGVCLRDESNYVPQFYKAKSPLFLEHETAILDTGEVDSESAN